MVCPAFEWICWFNCFVVDINLWSGVQNLAQQFQFQFQLFCGGYQPVERCSKSSSTAHNSISASLIRGDPALFPNFNKFHSNSLKIQNTQQNKTIFWWNFEFQNHHHYLYWTYKIAYRLGIGCSGLACFRAVNTSSGITWSLLVIDFLRILMDGILI